MKMNENEEDLEERASDLINVFFLNQKLDFFITCKNYRSKNTSVKLFYLFSWDTLNQCCGSGSRGSGTFRGSGIMKTGSNPDPVQNCLDPQHCSEFNHEKLSQSSWLSGNHREPLAQWEKKTQRRQVMSSSDEMIMRKNNAEACDQCLSLMDEFS